MTPVGDEIDHIVHTKIGLAGPGAVMGSINVFVLISLIVCGLFRNFRTSTAQCFLNLSSDVEWSDIVQKEFLARQKKNKHWTRIKQSAPVMYRTLPVVKFKFNRPSSGQQHMANSHNHEKECTLSWSSENATAIFIKFFWWLVLWFFLALDVCPVGKNASRTLRVVFPYVNYLVPRWTSGHFCNENSGELIDVLFLFQPPAHCLMATMHSGSFCFTKRS